MHNICYVKKRNIGSFSSVLVFIGMVLVSNLNADCVDLGGGHISCNESVNSDVYTDMSNGVSSSLLLDINTTNAYGVHNDNNGSWRFEGLNIATVGSGAYAAYIQSGGNISIGDNANITTNGSASYAVNAESGSNIFIGDNAEISAHGPNVPPTYSATPQSLSHAVVASGSNITIGDNANILTTGIGSYGVRTINNGISHIIIGDNVTIATTGGDTYCGNCGRTSPTTGWWSYGVVTEGAGSDITIGNNANISTQGAMAYALYTVSQNTAIYVGDNAAISTSGDRNSYAIYAQNSGKVFIGDNAHITTTGNELYLHNSSAGNGQPHAIYATGSGTLLDIGDNAVISTYGYDATAVSGTSFVNITIGGNARITTYGEGVNNTPNAVTNEGGFGVKIRGSSADFTLGDNAVITTYGNRALGVQIRETSRGVFGDNLTVITYGNNSAAIENWDRSNVTIGDNALIFTFGDVSHAIRALTSTGAGTATTIIGNGALISTSGDGSYAVFAEGRSAAVGSRIILNTDTNISVLGTDSYAIYSANTNALVTTNGTVKMNIFGNITAQNGGVVDLNLGDGSNLYGSTELGSNGASVINLTFDGDNSRWTTKGSSSLTNLYLTNSAEVDLTQSASYVTLSIDNLNGEGVFYQRINPFGNGDLIVINNSSSGNYELIFDKAAFGSYSATGDEEFLLIEQNASGAHSAVFTGEAWIGAYVYRVGNTSNAQYLTTGTPNGGGGSGGGGAPLNTIALSSISFANINYISNYANTQTLLQRLGEINHNRDTLDDIWIKTYAGKLDSFDKKFDIQDVDYYGLHGGFDRIYDTKSGKFFAGFMFGLSKTNIDYRLGDGKVSSYDMGLYASYKNERDFYIDTLLKHTRNENKFGIVVNGEKITGNSDMNAYLLSVESGKKFYVGNGFYVEPQAEITFSKQSGGTSVAESGLLTKFDSYNSILGRLSAVVGYSVKDAVNIYYKAGCIKEFDGEVSYSFNDSHVKNTYKLNGNIFDNALGITSTIRGNHHLYFEGTYQIGDNFNNKKANF
ncbi:MAG: autotransporter outer membrane beta-barrel domain-containing protein, partial [Campylobacteraceae bacterium]|nr:autotransporter outer membrane beta-barrel domain-containing protein [Campylobacteraceae bacterium]